MMIVAQVLALFASGPSRLLAGLLLVMLVCGGIYLMGRSDGGAACRVEGERDVSETVLRAERARADAERRDSDDRRLRDDDAFRRD